MTSRCGCSLSDSLLSRRQITWAVFSDAYDVVTQNAPFDSEIILLMSRRE